MQTKEFTSPVLVTRNETLQVEYPVNLNQDTALTPIFTTLNSFDESRFKSNLLQAFERDKQDIKCYCTFESEGSVRPVLFKKGTVQVAVYGLNYKDEEDLHSREEKFELPPGEEKNWFKILVFHRQMGKVDSEFCELVPPSWMDLIIYGGTKSCHYQRKYSFQGEFDFIESGNCVVTNYTDPLESGPRVAGLLTVVPCIKRGLWSYG